MRPPAAHAAPRGGASRLAHTCQALTSAGEERTGFLWKPWRTTQTPSTARCLRRPAPLATLSAPLRLWQGRAQPAAAAWRADRGRCEEGGGPAARPARVLPEEAHRQHQVRQACLWFRLPPSQKTLSCGLGSGVIHQRAAVAVRSGTGPWLSAFTTWRGAGRYHDEDNEDDDYD